MSKIDEITEGYKNLAIRNEEIEILAKKRQNICNTCNYNSKNESGLFGKTIPYCIVCGCIISAKIRSKDSTCPKNKW